MTVATSTNRMDLVAAAGQTIFPFTYTIYATTDLKVYVNGGLHALGVDYTVSGVYPTVGGNVTFLVGLAGGDAVVILRDIPYTQQTSLPYLSPFPEKSVETALDRMVILAQQLLGKVRKALAFDESSTALDVTIPESAACNSGYFLQSDGVGGVQWTQAVTPGSFTNPLAAIGDLIVSGPAGVPDRLIVGVNGQVLTADSTQPLGVKWGSGVGVDNIVGLNLANDAGAVSKQTIINIFPGTTWSDDADILNRVPMSITGTTLWSKTLAAWVVGCGNGGIVSNGGAVTAATCHSIFVIERPDTGAVDVAIDTSPTGANIVGFAGVAWTKKRRLGTVPVDTAGHFVGFVQDGDYFRLTTSITEKALTAPGNAAVTQKLSACPNHSVEAFGTVGLVDGAAAVKVLISDLGAADEAPSGTAAPLAHLNTQVGGVTNLAPWRIRTDSSGQVRWRCAGAGAGTQLFIATLGWYDRRGRG